MLSLNSLSNAQGRAGSPTATMASSLATDSPGMSRAHSEAKPKTRNPEERGEHADFQAYMAAYTAPLKPEIKNEAPAIKMDSPATEKPAPVQDKSAPQPTEPAAQYSAQKAGHEGNADSATNPATEAKEAGAAREENPAISARPQIVRAEKELLESLGLSVKKLSAETATTQKSEKAKSHNATAQAVDPKAPAAKQEKAQIAVSTLSQLQKAPDLVLANAEGLKRLSEKLGLVFLGKVSDKLNEKQNRSESSQTNTRHELRGEPAAQTTTAKAQKAGDGNAENSTNSGNQQKTGKGASARIVSRETELPATPALPATRDLSNPASMEPSGLKTNTHSAIDIRLAESVTTARATENMRAAVENPMLRGDLARQLQEVMSRAQILVADSQNAQFSVKLFPRELGRMEIDLKLIDGEIKGKIVVESEDVKNEMQNFFQNREQGGSGEQIDLNRIDIEVRSGNQNAQNPERTPDADTLIQNLVTRTAANTYESQESTAPQGTALYA